MVFDNERRCTTSNTRRNVIKSAGLAAVMGLAGCSGADGDENNNGDGGTVGSPSSGEWPDFSGEELHYIANETSDAAREFWNTAFGDFADETGVDVNIEYAGHDARDRIVQLVQAGNPPSMTRTSPSEAIEYMNLGASAPITELMSDLLDAKGEIPEQLIVNQDDEVWGMPFVVGAGAYFYRQDLADEAGVDEPNTWEKAIEYAEATDGIREGMHGTYVPAGTGSHSTNRYMMWLYSNEGSIAHWEDDEVRVNFHKGEAREKMIETLNFLNERHEYAPHASDSTYGTTQNAIPDGVAASGWYHGFRPMHRAKEAEVDWLDDFKLIQVPEKESRMGVAGSNQLVVFENANPEATKSFLEFFMTEGYYAQFFELEDLAPVHNIPTFAGVRNSDRYQEFLSDMKDTFGEDNISTYQEDIFNNSKPRPADTDPMNPYAGATYTSQPLFDLIQDALINDPDPDAILDDYAEELQAEIDAAQNQ